MLLYRLNRDEKIVAAFRAAKIIGCYGEEPDARTIGLLSDRIESLVERIVYRLMKQKHFLGHFAISSASFLAAYLIFSVLLRDPLPLIDEALLSLVVSFSIFRALRATLRRSPKTRQHKNELAELAGTIVFTPNRLIADAEKLMNKGITMAQKNAVDWFNPDTMPTIASEHSDIALQLDEMLAERYPIWRKWTKRFYRNWRATAQRVCGDKRLFDRLSPLFIVHVWLQRATAAPDSANN